MLRRLEETAASLLRSVACMPLVGGASMTGEIRIQRKSSSKPLLLCGSSCGMVHLVAPEFPKYCSDCSFDACRLDILVAFLDESEGFCCVAIVFVVTLLLQSWFVANIESVCRLHLFDGAQAMKEYCHSPAWVEHPLVVFDSVVFMKHQKLVVSITLQG